MTVHSTSVSHKQNYRSIAALHVKRRAIKWSLVDTDALDYR